MSTPIRKPTDQQRCDVPGQRDPRHRLGRLGEDLAAAHLERLGFAVLERNRRTPCGEIDLVASDGEVIVFAEVKTRRAPRRAGGARPHEEPLSWLRARQRARLRRAATVWLAERDRPRTPAAAVRFDAIGVIVDGRGRLLGLEHLEGAW
ncbi:MAG TPA: YraN family protein [Solirubrobacteraceae bacterium]|nr:YraN family protein [Solirubrobacteraceae bacterium]